MKDGRIEEIIEKIKNEGDKDSISLREKRREVKRAKRLVNYRRVDTCWNCAYWLPNKGDAICALLLAERKVAYIEPDHKCNKWTSRMPDGKSYTER